MEVSLEGGALAGLEAGMGLAMVEEAAAKVEAKGWAVITVELTALETATVEASEVVVMATLGAQEAGAGEGGSREEVEDGRVRRSV